LKRKIQLGIVSFIVGSLMVFSPTGAFAESAMTTIICANEQGEERTYQVGWDNSNQFFNGRGEIPRLWCEGGYAGPYTTYVSDELPVDSPLRYYNGIAPSPTPVVIEPTPEPTETVEPEPVPSVVPSLDPEPTPIPEPTQSESPSPEPIIEPVPVVTPSVTPEPEPTPIPSESVEEVVEVEPDPSPTPIEAPTPEIVPEETPEPEPTIAIAAPVSDTEQFLAEVSIQLPTYLENVPGIVQIAATAEAIMAIGSDMTPEEREESQGVVVAAVIVGQLAQVRRLK